MPIKMLNLQTISAIVFYTILAIVIYIKRDKFELMNKILIVHKTKKGLGLMNKLSKYRNFWKAFSTVAIPVAIVAMCKVGSMLFSNAMDMITGGGVAAVAPAIPGVKIPGSPIFIPFWQGIIAIGILAVVHEFAHGIVAMVEDIEIKNAGFGLLLVLPLAFVEPDEDDMEKKSKLARLRMLSSGAFANICVWAIISILMFAAFTPFIDSLTIEDGVEVKSVKENLAASEAGLEKGNVIVSVNNESTKSVDELLGEVNEHDPGDEITIGLSSGESEKVELGENPANESNPYLGVYLEQNFHYEESFKQNYGWSIGPLNWSYNLMFWVSMLNLAIGVMNFLPIWGLDGSRILYNLGGFFTENEKVLGVVMRAIFSFFLMILLFNLIGTFVL